MARSSIHQEMKMSPRAGFMLVVMAVLTIGCGAREPGPLPSEFGKVTYWRALSSSVGFTACTDAAGWQSSIAAPKIEENSYVMYRLSADGKTATAQSCTTTLASSCTDLVPAIVFIVTGHTLIYDAPSQVRDLQGTACGLQADQVWTIEDRGEDASFKAALTFNLVGPVNDCAALDAQIKSEGTNGFGIDGCGVDLGVELEFDKAQAP
jgi:hypothetical protein